MKKTKKLRLYKFQRIDIEKIQNKFGGRCLLASEMGSGKSAQAVRWVRKHAPRGQPIVIICPASLKWNWQNEVEMWGFGKLETKVLSSRTPPKRLPRLHERDRRIVYIINYDVLAWWLPWLKALNPSTIICDECHAIKNRRAKRTKAVRNMCRRVPHVIMISGTPLTNRPAELWPALNILRPKQFPSFFSFCEQFARPKKTVWGWDFGGAKNLDVLHDLLKETCMIRRRKKDVLKQLPSKTRTLIPVDLSAKDMKTYQKAEQNYIQWLTKIAPHKAKRARKAVSLSRMMGLKILAAELKLPFVFTWISDFLEETDGKLIVFGIHKRVLLPLFDRFRKISVLVNGDVIGRKKQEAIDRFRNLKKKRLFFGNIQAAGVGWNGTVASNVLFIEIGWTPRRNDSGRRPDSPDRHDERGDLSLHGGRQRDD